MTAVNNTIAIGSYDYSLDLVKLYDSESDIYMANLSNGSQHRVDENGNVLYDPSFDVDSTYDFVFADQDGNGSYDAGEFGVFFTTESENQAESFFQDDSQGQTLVKIDDAAPVGGTAPFEGGAALVSVLALAISAKRLMKFFR